MNIISSHRSRKIIYCFLCIVLLTTFVSCLVRYQFIDDVGPQAVYRRLGNSGCALICTMRLFGVDDYATVYDSVYDAGLIRDDCYINDWQGLLKFLAGYTTSHSLAPRKYLKDITMVSSQSPMSNIYLIEGTTATGSQHFILVVHKDNLTYTFNPDPDAEIHEIISFRNFVRCVSY